MLAAARMLDNLIQLKIGVIFGVRLENEKGCGKLIKNLHENANSILEYFEYFCQISPKSIFIILSCTVSKSVHF